ncbi:uncharacterized protein BKA55DRAFT_553215 [Fusarium redolens]|jgi:hypothetical protein|uniref:Uncharacterized protein n=1 Tax=Fusarium redolens TaxID=48865 RepID=A0A9P9KQP9_FUSRE|nr:uncharacterized protein BKA55DRAFT_553215 [Fusarium redolens]KAH7266758.1 hypothetical protein BKA55DRAFT_553215 [Fusarium redolens]
MVTPSSPTVNESSRTTRDEDKGKTKPLFDEVVRLGMLFKTGSHRCPEGQSIVPRQVSFDSMPESGLTDEQLVEEFASIALKSSNSNPPNSFGISRRYYVPCCTRGSPLDTTTEPEYGGVFTPGGCLSNTVALLAARENIFLDQV